MKEFLKKCKVANFSKQIKQIVDKVEENSKFISARRRTANVSLADDKAIVSQICFVHSTPKMSVSFC